ncbi:unnamed protein product, partial [Prunus brigantina]
PTLHSTSKPFSFPISHLFPTLSNPNLPTSNNLHHNSSPAPTTTTLCGRPLPFFSTTTSISLSGLPLLDTLLGTSII